MDQLIAGFTVSKYILLKDIENHQKYWYRQKLLTNLEL